MKKSKSFPFWVCLYLLFGSSMLLAIAHVVRALPGDVKLERARERCMDSVEGDKNEAASVYIEENGEGGWNCIVTPRTPDQNLRKVVPPTSENQEMQIDIEIRQYEPEPIKHPAA